MDYGNCATQTTHKRITAEENRRKLTINNPSAKVIRKIKVDGCLIIDSGKRCDYMFEILENTQTNKIVISTIKAFKMITRIFFRI